MRMGGGLDANTHLAAGRRCLRGADLGKDCPSQFDLPGNPREHFDPVVRLFELPFLIVLMDLFSVRCCLHDLAARS